MRCYFEISRGKNKGKRTGRREKKEGEDGAGNGKEWEKGKQRGIEKEQSEREKPQKWFPLRRNGLKDNN